MSKKKQKRVYETIPLNEVIEHQKRRIRLEKEERNKKDLEDMKLKYEFELEKNKQGWMASEDVRRKRYLEKEVTRIKEQTIKSIEPEM